jgi:hypothetical protein
VSKHIFQRTRNSIHKYGTTICHDGWDNVTQCPLLNITFGCSSGDVFVHAIDTIGEHNDAQYICNALVGYIESIGMDNIVQVMFRACEM